MDNCEGVGEAERDGRGIINNNIYHHININIIMASQVRIESFIYRINPDDDRELQRRSIGGNSWSRVTGFNGNHILDLLLAPNGKDIEVYTDRYVYVREYSGGIRKK